MTIEEAILLEIASKGERIVGKEQKKKRPI